jgi:chemotaxis protein CheX
MDVRLINPFISAVQHVFRTMVQTEVRMGKPYIKMDGGSSADVSGVIGFSGDATGCVVLSFPKAVACRAASAFAGTAIDQNHPDFADAIGELANIVAGNAKKELNGLHVEISLPSVVIGSEHVISQSRSVPRLVLPCETVHGRFFVEVGMRVEEPASAPAGAGP